MHDKYDFEKDVWPDNERMPYKLLRWGFLDFCYVVCRRAIRENYGKNWHWANEYTQAHHEGNTFSFPIEELMIEVLTLIMLGGRGSDDAVKYHRANIAELLSKNNLQDLLLQLPDEERQEFEYDLRLLKII